MPLGSAAVRLQPASGLYTSPCWLLQELESPLTPGTANSARAYLEVRLTLCPLWALKQAVRVLPVKHSPLNPGLRMVGGRVGCSQSPASLSHSHIPFLDELAGSESGDESLPCETGQRDLE